MSDVDLVQRVVNAAEALVDVKREAQKVFRTGLHGMPQLVRTSPVAKMLADRTAALGKKLEEAVDAYRNGVS